MSIELFCFWSLSFVHFRKLSWRLECLICSIRMVTSLGKDLALNLFFCSNAGSMLGYSANSSSSAMAMFMGFPFLNSAHPLHVHRITFLVDLCVTNPYIEQPHVFSKAWRTHSRWLSSFPLCLSFWRITGRWWFWLKGNKCFLNE